MRLRNSGPCLIQRASLVSSRSPSRPATSPGYTDRGSRSDENRTIPSPPLTQTSSSSATTFTGSATAALSMILPVVVSTAITSSDSRQVRYTSFAVAAAWRQLRPSACAMVRFDAVSTAVSVSPVPVSTQRVPSLRGSVSWSKILSTLTVASTSSVSGSSRATSVVPSPAAEQPQSVCPSVPMPWQYLSGFVVVSILTSAWTLRVAGLIRTT